MIKAKTGERLLDSGGLSTFVLSKDNGSWKIRHTSTAARRRPAGGVSDQAPSRRYR
jgi:hypothetical protein